MEELRKAHPDSTLAKLKLQHIVDHMEAFVKSLDEKPAIIGHSMGGLVVQLLLQRDLAVAGIAIDPAPPAGVFTTEFSFLKANFPAINPFLLNQPVRMSFEHFQYAFVNTLPLEEQRTAYDRYVVPESRGVPTSSLGAAGKVDFHRPRRPFAERLTATAPTRRVRVWSRPNAALARAASRRAPATRIHRPL